MVKHKSVFQNHLPSSLLSYYTYLYFIRPSVFSPLYARSLFLFNCLYFSKATQKILCRLGRQNIHAKPRYVFANKHNNRMYGLKPYGRVVSTQYRRYNTIIKRYRHNLGYSHNKIRTKCMGNTIYLNSSSSGKNSGYSKLKLNRRYNYCKRSYGNESSGNIRQHYRHSRGGILHSRYGVHNKYSSNHTKRGKLGIERRKQCAPMQTTSTTRIKRVNPPRSITYYIRSIYAMRRHNPAMQYFVHNLFRKRSFLRRGNKLHRSRRNFNLRLWSLLRKYLGVNASKSSIRSAFKYLHSRIFFFRNLFYLYRLCLTMYRSVKCVRRRFHLHATPQPYRRFLSSMVHHLACISFVQNIFVNSKIGKLGKPDRTRDIWYDIVRPITRLVGSPVYHKDRKPLSRIVGYIKISERFDTYMKYLMKYFAAVHSFFRYVVCSIGSIGKSTKLGSNVHAYVQPIRRFNSVHNKVLKFIPIVFRGCDYIYSYILKQFRLNRLKIGKYKLKLYNRQIRIVHHIKNVLYHFSKEFMPRLLFRKRTHIGNYILKHRIFLSRCVKLAKTFIIYRMYRFFNSLFLFTCAHHSSADNYYLHNGGDMFRYNYLLSCSNLFPSNSGGIGVVKDYCSKFLHNSSLNYNLVVRTSRSNCTAVLLVNDKVIYSSSCGKIGFLKTNRSTYFASNQLGFFLCLFLSSVYGLYLRSGQLQFRPKQFSNLRKYLFNNGYKKFIRRYRMFKKKQRKSTIIGKGKCKKRIRKRTKHTQKNLHLFDNYSLRRRSRCLRTERRRSYCNGIKLRTKSALVPGRLSSSRLRWLAKYRSRFMLAWSNYCVYLLLQQRATRRYNFNTSVASVKLNIHMAGTGISRLAVRKPIRRFVNMIRRATNGGQFFDRSVDASDMRYMGINQLDDSNYLNAEHDPNDDVTSDSDGCLDISYNHGSEVHSFNTDELDSIVNSSKYSPKFRTIIDNPTRFMRLVNRGRMAGPRSKKCTTLVDRHHELIRTVSDILKPRLHGLQRRDTRIFYIKKVLKLKAALYNRVYSLCMQFVSLYRRLRSNCTSTLLHEIRRYSLKNSLSLSGRIFMLSTLYGCFNVLFVPVAIRHITNTTRPVLSYVSMLLFTKRYILSLLTLRLFLSTLNASSSYSLFLDTNQSRFCTTVIYLYMYWMHYFVPTLIILVQKQPGALLSFSLAHVLFVLLNSSIVIEFFLYDSLVALFSVFFKQVHRLIIVVAQFRRMVYLKYASMIKNIFATLNSSSCYAQNKSSNYGRGRNKNGLLVLYNQKTASVPHNGCRARKVRRK